jgi:hypothetical protein
MYRCHAVNRASGFPIHGQHKYWIENGNSKSCIINIMWGGGGGGGGENCYTLCGVPVQAQAVNLPTGKCNIKCSIN